MAPKSQNFTNIEAWINSPTEMSVKAHVTHNIFAHNIAIKIYVRDYLKYQNILFLTS